MAFKVRDLTVGRPRLRRRPASVIGPATIIDTVVRFSSAQSFHAMRAFDETYQALQSLLAIGLPVPGPSALAASFAAGMRCGEFHIVRLIRSFDETDLYEARSAAGFRVALKLLRSGGSAESRQMMSRQTAIFRSLGGLYFPTVHSSGSIDGQTFLALNWVDGVPLDLAASRLRGVGHSSLPALRRLCANLLNALASLHHAGIGHNDIHPGNVRVRPDGSVCILDLGLRIASEPVE